VHVAHPDPGTGGAVCTLSVAAGQFSPDCAFIRPPIQLLGAILSRIEAREE